MSLRELGRLLLCYSRPLLNSRSPDKVIDKNVVFSYPPRISERVISTFELKNLAEIVSVPNAADLLVLDARE